MATTSRRKPPRPRFGEDIPVTHQIAEAIGHAVVEWGRTEDTAGVLTASLMNVDHTQFRAVASNMMTGGKFDALAAVAQLRLPPRKAATILNIVKEIKGLQAERNRIVHGRWFRTRNPEVAERHAYRAYGSLTHKQEAVSVGRIAGHTADVVRLGRRLNYALERQGLYRRSP
jgi:hypothetical protein